MFLLAWRNCKREEKRSLAAEIFDQLQIKDKSPLLLSIQNCDKGIGEKVATAGWKVNFALKETLIICDFYPSFACLSSAFFWWAIGGLACCILGQSPNVLTNMIYECLFKLHISLLYLVLVLMWSVLKAGWIYELEAAKWDLDLDRINPAAKFRIAYWSSSPLLLTTHILAAAQRCDFMKGQIQDIS